MFEEGRLRCPTSRKYSIIANRGKYFPQWLGVKSDEAETLDANGCNSNQKLHWDHFNTTKSSALRKEFYSYH